MPRDKRFERIVRVIPLAREGCHLRMHLTDASSRHEVGLGQTVEAGLVISQRWAERKRRILVITPSNVRKQWHQELSEKF